MRTLLLVAMLLAALAALSCSGRRRAAAPSPWVGLYASHDASLVLYLKEDRSATVVLLERSDQRATWTLEGDGARVDGVVSGVLAHAPASERYAFTSDARPGQPASPSTPLVKLEE